MTADIIAKVLTAAAILAVTSHIVSAQDLHCESGDLEVRGLDFSGNKTFRSSELENAIVTTPSSWGRRTLNLPFSTKRCLDRTEYANDRLRLIVFYRRHGFPDATVDTAITQSGPGGVRVRFTIVEGTPIVLHSFVVTGIDSVLYKDAVLQDLPIREGERFDRAQIEAAIDSITRRLHNHGYPAAVASNFYGIHAGSHGLLAEDSIIVQPGPLTRIGAVHVTVTPISHHGQQIGDQVVRRLVDIDSGRIYRERDLAAAQRSLYQTDAYTRVSVGLDSTHGLRVGGDSIVPLEVSLIENTMHSARIGAGYGTLDCFRVSGELDDYDFLSGARHLQLQGRLSKIGIGKPLNAAPGTGVAQLCQQAQHDLLYSPDSTRLDYYIGATLAQPFLFGLNTVPTITAYRSRVSEYNAYVRTTDVGGIASVVWQRSVRTPVTFSYSMDFGRTEAQPALFCAVFNLCDSEDRARVEQNLRLAIVSAVIAHNWSNSTTSPTTGGTVRLEMRHASPWVLSDTALQFNTLLGDVAKYFSLGNGNVLALHLRAGAVFGRGFRSNTGFIPPQERMYAGGPNSVRGFAQNDLGAVAYITTQPYDSIPIPGAGNTSVFQDTVGSYRRVVPVGGNSLVVGNVELRLRSPVLPDVLQFGLFVDAGDVWNRGTDLALAHIPVTPGIQVAALTPIGPVRLVVGYNSSPLPKGPLYYESSSSLTGTLPCVSPGNTLPVANGTPGVQAPGSCPSTFIPAQSSSFRSKLTFGLAIGQAF